MATTARRAGYLFAFALAVRLLWLVAWNSRFQYTSFQDSKYSPTSYDNFVNVAEYYAGLPGGVENLQRPPLYPWFLALVFRIFGESLHAVQAVQLLLSAVVVLFPYLLLRRYDLERAGLLGSLLMAVDPLLLYYGPNQLQAEVLFLPFFLAALGLSIAAFETGSFKLAAGAGLSAGAGIMARVTLMPFTWSLAAAPLFAPAPRKRAFALAAAIVACTWLWTTPWCARNWLKYGKFTLSYYTGRGLYEGLSVGLEETNDLAESMQREQSADKKTEFEWDDIYRKRAIERIRERPGDYAVLLVRKAVKYWRLAPYKPYPLWARLMVGAWSAGLFALAAWGAWLLREQRTATGVFALYLLTATAIHAVFFNRFRYRLPLEPVLCLWAGLALTRAWEDWWELRA